MWEEKPVQIGQLRLNLASGPDDGAPILLLHGAARSWRDYSPIIGALAGRWRCLAVDFRGHGRSDRANSYLVTDYVRDTVSFLRNYQSKPAVLWGHSLGAMVAVGAAAYAADRVAGIIVEDPPFHTMGRRISQTLVTYFSGLRECAARRNLSVAQMAHIMSGIRMPVVDGRSLALQDVRDSTQIRFGARCLLDLDPAVIDPIVSGEWLDGYDTAALLPEVRCPALLLAADYASGGMLTPEDAALMPQLIPDCVRVDFPHAGHLLHWQHTEDVMRHVLAFLETF